MDYDMLPPRQCDHKMTAIPLTPDIQWCAHCGAFRQGDMGWKIPTVMFYRAPMTADEKRAA
jgi:hypothetical protein